MKIFRLIIISCLFLCTGCDGPDSLEVALSHAGNNRMEFEKVFSHYEDDSLKLCAAQFLIENMPYHFSVMETMVSPEGKEYYPDITQFDGKESVKRHCDSLFAIGYRVRKQHVFDIRTLTADYLIDQIDLAFEAWGKPWTREVSFDDFCRYVLPYRAENEAVCNIRRQLMDTYIPLLDSAGVRSVD
ncbi:MAG: transglutaminase domain-containing protein, partial [Bacteroides sp]|nr:transglutaminase domain-containing protein [Bacteroides sp.]